MTTFEFDGKKYAEVSRHQTEWGESLLAGIQLKGNEAVLDLGCGDGRLTEQLASLVFNGKVTGIDASSGMIECARRRRRNNLQFIQMNINDLDFHNEFDIIFSNAALHWIKDHRKLLKNIINALKDNGRIFWNFAAKGNCANFFEVIRAIIKKPEYSPFFTDFQWPWYMPSVDEYKDLLNNSVFSEIIVDEENRDRYFTTVDEMTGWLDQPTIVPFLQRIPETIKPTFRQEIITAMLHKTIQPDGRCFETFRRLLVIAKKNKFLTAVKHK